MKSMRPAVSPVAVILARALRDLLREPRALLATLALPLLLYPLLFLLGGRLLTGSGGGDSDGAWRLGLSGELRHLEPWLAGEGVWIEALPERAGEELASGRIDAALERAPDGKALRLLHRGSEALRGRVEAALGRWHQARLLEQAGEPARTARAALLLEERALPLKAPPGFGVLSFLPLVLVLVVLSGTAFVALDLLPGERERGSLEALLAQPITPGQVLLGSYLATLLAGLAALALNLLGLAAVAALLPSAGADPKPGLWAAARLFLLAAPLALSLTALLTWAMALARSFREGQAYLLPLTLGAMLPASMGLSGALELDGISALIPLVGPVLVLREGLAGWPVPGLLLVVAAASLLWTVLALTAAAHQVGSEEGRLAEDPLAALDAPHAPPGRRALLWAVILLFAFLVLAPPLSVRLGAAGQAGAQIGLLLLPALLLPRLLGLPFERAFPLRRTGPAALAGTVLVAAGAALLGLHLLALQRLLLPLPEALLSDLRRALPHGDLGLLLLMGAVLPGLCEEALFRGPLLGAFRSHWGPGRALLLSSALFAAMHFSVYRFFPAFAAGLSFGALALATRSLPLTCLCHALHNGLVLTAAVGAWPAQAAALLPGTGPGRAALLAALGGLTLLLGLGIGRIGRR